MSISWDDVALLSPPLAAAPADLQDLILAIVDRQIDDDAWGEFANDGRRYLAAHLGSLSYPGGDAAAGALTSERLGPMARTYGLPADVSGELATTKFGLFFKHLLRVAIGPGAMVP